MQTNQIIQQFLKARLIEPATPFGSGHINDTFRFSIEENGEAHFYVLQRINHEVFKEPEKVMDNIQTIALFLKGGKKLSSSFHPFTGYPKKVLSPIPTTEGKLFFKDDSNLYWRIFPYIQNSYSIETVQTEEQAYLAASAFGEYLNALKTLNVESLHYTIPNFHNGVRRLDTFKSILKNAVSKRLDKSKREIEQILKHQAIFPKIASMGFPLRVTHNDTKINNVLFDKTTQKPSAIIDLDTVMPGIVLSDFGDMVRTFTTSVAEDEADFALVEMRRNIYTALYEGFLTEMKDLTSLERNHLFDGAKWIVLMQGLRFLTDYLEGDVYYKTSYEDHNLVRTKNQLALFDSMR